MSLERKLNRYLQSQAGIKTRRGVRHQIGRHIIARGVSNYRRFVICGVTKIVHGMRPAELHATKGWRTVPAWT